MRYLILVQERIIGWDANNGATIYFTTSRRSLVNFLLIPL